jgi:hypothetical protein
MTFVTRSPGLFCLLPCAFADACDKSHCALRNFGDSGARYPTVSRGRVRDHTIDDAEVRLSTSVYFAVVAGTATTHSAGRSDLGPEDLPVVCAPCSFL